jgi:hypothetical protein
MKTFRLSKISTKNANKAVFETTRNFLNGINSKRAKSTLALLNEGKFDEIATQEINPSEYGTSAEFFDDYCAISFLKKWESLPTSFDKKAIALQGFLDAEQKNKETNQKLQDFWGRKIIHSDDQLKFNFELKAKISKILGKVPDIASLDYRFGPGATSACKGNAITIADKLSVKPECTLSAMKHVHHIFERDLLLKGACFQVDNVSGPFSVTSKIKLTNFNSLAFVPKTGKTDRCICIEPHLNTLLQKGVGTYLRDRLKLNGLDLRKQAEINGEYAKLGSIDGSYATIDLQAASDTISTELVYQLLPNDWFELLDDLRSHYTQLPTGKLIYNEKFSSMGNGFTFELETLIFWCIAQVEKELSKTNGEVMTFGDDIIVPTEMATSLIDRLTYFGFSINAEKTFITGPFRESCGKDYFQGRLVRPYFLKKDISNVKDLYSIANGVRNLAIRQGLFDFADKRLRSCWLSIIRRIPKKFRYFGPQCLGDGVIFAPRSEHQGCYTNNQIRRCYTLIAVPEKRDLNRYGSSSVQLASLLFGASTYLPIRGSTRCHRRISTAIPTWDWLEGSWR